MLPSCDASRPRCDVSPRPSCPAELAPQHLTCLLDVTAQAWSDPHDTLLAVTPAPRLTATRLSPISEDKPPIEGAAFPPPSCPSVFCPQHLINPPSRSAHAKPAPADTCFASSLVAGVSPCPTSTVCIPTPSLASPTPSWPFSASPQHSITPEIVTAHVCC